MNRTHLAVALCVLSPVVMAVACGGTSQAPAEVPAEPIPPAAEPTPAETDDAGITDSGMPEGEHTMPDGSTMP